MLCVFRERDLKAYRCLVCWQKWHITSEMLRYLSRHNLLWREWPANTASNGNTSQPHWVLGSAELNDALVSWHAVWLLLRRSHPYLSIYEVEGRTEMNRTNNPDTWMGKMMEKEWQVDIIDWSNRYHWMDIFMNGTSLFVYIKTLSVFYSQLYLLRFQEDYLSIYIYQW